MKKRKFRYTSGGDVDVDPTYGGGYPTSEAKDDVSSDSEEVRDEAGVKSKFRRNLETGELYSPDEPVTRSFPKPKPKTAAKPAVSTSAKSTSSADIPKGSAVAPASTGADTSGPSNLDRILMGIPVAGAGVAGVAKLAQMRRAKQAAEAAETAKRFTSPQARQVTTDTGRRFSPKAEMEAAESTMRGAVGRKDIQAKRAEAAKGRAEAMERNKPVMQATPKKASPRSRTRDEDVDYELRAKGGRIGYAKGGSVRGGGCEQRGKTRGRMV